MAVADGAVRVDEVERRPVVVVEGAPDLVVVVDRDGVADPSLRRRLPHAVDVVLERELRRVDADDDQPVVPIGIGPRTDVRLGPQPVDARQRPEVDEDDAPVKLGQVERLGVEPRDRAAERGHVETVERGHRPWRTAAKWSCTSWTAIAPSPTAVAHRFVDPERTSPAAKIPGTLVSRRLVGAGGGAGEDEAPFVAMHRLVDPLGAWKRAEEQEQEREGETLAALQRDSLEPAAVAVELRDLAAVANGDARTVHLVNQVVGHRLAHVGAPVEQRHERAAAREPDRGLAR